MTWYQLHELSKDTLIGALIVMARILLNDQAAKDCRCATPSPEDLLHTIELAIMKHLAQR